MADLFRLEVDEATKSFNAFQEKVEKYNQVQTEKERLHTIAIGLKEQLERKMDEIEAKEQEIKELKKDIKTFLDHLKLLPDQQGSTPVYEGPPLPTPPQVNTTDTPPQEAHSTATAFTAHSGTRADEGDDLDINAAGKASRMEPLTGGEQPITASGPSSIIASSAPTASPVVITAKVAKKIAHDLERVHGVAFSEAQVQTILDQYPHSCFKDGNLFLRRCLYCASNGITPRGQPARFIQGDLGFIRHIRTHGFMSGVGGKNINDHCVLGEPVSWDDVLLMRERQQPDIAIVINFGKGDVLYKDFEEEVAKTTNNRRASAVAFACDTKEDSITGEAGGSAEGNNDLIKRIDREDPIGKRRVRFALPLAGYYDFDDETIDGTNQE